MKQKKECLQQNELYFMFLILGKSGRISEKKVNERRTGKEIRNAKMEWKSRRKGKENNTENTWRIKERDVYNRM